MVGPGRGVDTGEKESVKGLEVHHREVSLSFELHFLDRRNKPKE